MNHEVKYNGYSASPSDYESPDGDLADVINLIPEDGSLKVISQPKAIFSYLEHDILFAHETSEYTHYIGKSGNELYWLTEGEEQSAKLIYDFGEAEILQVTAVGNTLVVLTTEGIRYALWKNETSDYIYLGVMPECPISFGLQGELERYSDLTYESGNKENGLFTITFHALSSNDAPFTEENQTKITDPVLAKVNRFVQEVSTNKNRFIYPFFVRYAFRLYDDSLTRISAPVLMLPCTGPNPKVFTKGFNIQESGYTSTRCDICTISAELDYQALISEEEKSVLKAWGELIKSVDIFISAPIYTYDQSGKCERFVIADKEHSPGNFVGKFNPKRDVFPTGADGITLKLYYQSWGINDLAKIDTLHLSNEHDTDYPIPSPGTIVELPKFDAQNSIEKRISECSNFFYLTSIDIEDLSIKERVKVEFEDGILGSITNREVMPDDYQTHDTLIAKRSFGYNGRLNLAGVQRKLFEGFNLASMVSYVNGHAYFGNISYAGPSFAENGTFGKWLSSYTHLKTSQGNFLLRSEDAFLSPEPQDIYYLYYPDTTADKMYISHRVDVDEDGDGEIDDSTQADRYYNLEPHDFLNGSFYFSLKGIDNGHQESLATTPNAFVDATNKIYTSEINNPFYFPLLGINAVGSGEVLGISTAAKALSQGQFGQFPLYAFTTEGVWALEVASNGSYSARQPITRDVCINPDSITQIDSAVLFATDRGIMLLSGSETMCITDILDSKEAFSLLDLPRGDELSSLLLGKSNEGVFERVPFKKYLPKCGMLYDYKHQRIIVFNPDYEYAYVYSLESKQWGLIISGIAHAVPSYPNALAMSRLGSTPGTLWDFSEEENTPSERCLLVTRPLKLGYADTLKTVDNIIQRGYFKKGHVQTALYGSRDLMNWHLVASSTDHYLRGFRGTPYKFFRMVILGDLEPKESLYGCSIQYEAKRTNQPR